MVAGLTRQTALRLTPLRTSPAGVREVDGGQAGAARGHYPRSRQLVLKARAVAHAALCSPHTLVRNCLPEHA